MTAENLSLRPRRNENIANDSNEKMTILVADDDSETLDVVVRTIEELGHIALKAGNGKEVIEFFHLQGPRVDAVFLDRIMPYMDGPAVSRFMAHDPVLRLLPVIMQNNDNDPVENDANIFYQLRKPYDMALLRAVLSAAIRQAQKNRRLQRRMSHYRAGFGLTHTAKFRFRTLAQAEDLACFIANFFPDPEHVVTGLAELMINAIEHGNLRIGEKEKEDLIRSGRWKEEVAKRLADPACKDLYAEIAMTRRDGGIYVVITDQGEGFAWQNYVRITPEQAARISGRGIAHAATVCFDALRYDAVGNKAIGFVREDRPLSW